MFLKTYKSLGWSIFARNIFSHQPYLLIFIHAKEQIVFAKFFIRFSKSNFWWVVVSVATTDFFCVSCLHCKAIVIILQYIFEKMFLIRSNVNLIPLHYNAKNRSVKAWGKVSALLNTEINIIKISCPIFFQKENTSWQFLAFP